MGSRTKIVLVTFLLACLAMVLWKVLPDVILLLRTGYIRSHTIVVGEERRIIVLKEFLWEGSQGLKFQIVDQGRAICEPIFFGNKAPGTGDMAYSVLRTPDGDVVGIADSLEPQVVLIICRFRDCEWWPADCGSKSHRAAVGRRLIERLKDGTGTMDLVLGSEVYGKRIASSVY